jgi:hypothetical protein
MVSAGPDWNTYSNPDLFALKFSAMSEYKFVSVWTIEAVLPRVWAAIKDPMHWPEWWKGVISVRELVPGDSRGLGSVHRSVWKSVLPYRLEFDSEVVRTVENELIEAKAFGELEGVGLWQFRPVGGGRTRVQYDWKVRATKPWMRFLSPVARPVFRWNHDVIMRWGETGLNRYLLKTGS